MPVSVIRKVEEIYEVLDGLHGQGTIMIGNMIL